MPNSKVFDETVLACQQAIKNAQNARKALAASRKEGRNWRRIYKAMESATKHITSLRLEPDEMRQFLEWLKDIIEKALAD